jgi:hypothetical protein
VILVTNGSPEELKILEKTFELHREGIGGGLMGKALIKRAQRKKENPKKGEMRGLGLEGAADADMLIRELAS